MTDQEQHLMERLHRRDRRIDELRAALKNSPCPTGPRMVQDCIARGQCGCDNRTALGSPDDTAPEVTK